MDPHGWVQQHADYLYRYALSRLDDEEQARDLVQETFLAALERLDQFKGNSTERTWLTAILKYKVIDIYRKRSSGLRRNTGSARDRGESGVETGAAAETGIEAQTGAETGNGNETVAEAEREQQDFFDPVTGHWMDAYGPQPLGVEDKDPLENKELASILHKCLQRLPALWLSVFTMKHVDDEPSEAVCSELKLTASNFWVIMHRAKLNLRACLQKNWL